MDKEKYINQLFPVLFWDVDRFQLDMDTYPSLYKESWSMVNGVIGTLF